MFHADALQTNGKGDEATQALQRAIDLDPARPEAKAKLESLQPKVTAVPGAATGQGGQFVVAGTGSSGGTLRKTPSTSGEPLKVLPDGTLLVDLGEEQQAEGRGWRKVRDGSGAVGWIAAELIKTAGASQTVAARPGDSSDAQAYARNMEPKLIDAVQALNAFSAAAAKFGQNAALYSNVQWRLEMSTALGLMLYSGQQLAESRQVPPQLSDVDRLLRQAGRDMQGAATDIADGLDHLNMAKFQSANTKLLSVGASVAQADAKLKDISTPSPVPVVLDAPPLGGTKSAWIAAHGTPSRGVVGELFGRDVEVSFGPTAGGVERAYHVELLFAQAVPVAQARERARSLRPSDAQLVRTYTAKAGQTVEVFRSAQLERAFAGSMRLPGVGWFGDAPPGTFIQIAQRGTPTTTRVVLALGDNP